MAKISDFDLLVRADIATCPDFIIERQAIRVVRDFCQQTYIWQDWLLEYLEVGFDEYELSYLDAEIYKILDVRFSGQSISAVTYNRPGLEDGEINIQNGIDGYIFDPPGTLRFIGLPTDSGEMFINVVLQPSLDTCEVPDWLLERYEDTLISGIIYRLGKQVKQQWTDFNLATFHFREYRKGIASARIQKFKQHTNASLRVKSKKFI